MNGMAEFLQMKVAAKECFAERVAEAGRLQIVAKGDALFLRHVPFAKVPTRD